MYDAFISKASWWFKSIKTSNGEVQEIGPVAEFSLSPICLHEGINVFLTIFVSICEVVTAKVLLRFRSKTLYHAPVNY